MHYLWTTSNINAPYKSTTSNFLFDEELNIHNNLIKLWSILPARQIFLNLTNLFR